MNFIESENCSASCGGGTKARWRDLMAGDPSICSDVVQELRCNEHPCHEDCVLSKEWTVWSGCSSSCGGGHKSRWRPVVTPALYGGKPCDDVVEKKECNKYRCPLPVCPDPDEYYLPYVPLGMVPPPCVPPGPCG